LTKAKRILAYVLRFVRVIALRLHAKNPNNLEISISLKERLNLASTTLAGREVKYAEKNELQVHFPFESLDNELEDSSYAPPLDIPVIHTKTQAIQALQSSCKLTERFWQVWYTQYLTALREKHQTKVGKKRAGALVPKVGSLVLICDEVQPRHMWRMGRISALPTNRDGVVREAVIKLPSHKHIRRPINLLVPLELEDTAENDCQDEQDTRHSETQEADGIAQEERQVVEPAHGYNLRSRSRQSQEHRNGSANVGLVSASILLLILALSSFCPSVATIAANSPQLKSTDFEASYRTYWVNKLTPEIQASYKIQSRRLDRPQGGEIIKRAHPAKHKTLPQDGYTRRRWRCCLPQQITHQIASKC
ncbi:hypothetical protein GCK32_019541, partial [Trichostrongylus colubriformis]